MSILTKISCLNFGSLNFTFVTSQEDHLAANTNLWHTMCYTGGIDWLSFFFSSSYLVWRLLLKKQVSKWNVKLVLAVIQVSYSGLFCKLFCCQGTTASNWPHFLTSSHNNMPPSLQSLLISVSLVVALIVALILHPCVGH